KIFQPVSVRPDMNFYMFPADSRIVFYYKIRLNRFADNKSVFINRRLLTGRYPFYICLHLHIRRKKDCRRISCIDFFFRLLLFPDWHNRLSDNDFFLKSFFLSLRNLHIFSVFPSVKIVFHPHYPPDFTGLFEYTVNLSFCITDAKRQKAGSAACLLFYFSLNLKILSFFFG